MRIEDEIDPADQLGAGMDLLRTATAALTARDLQSKKTRQAIANSIDNAIETMEPVHEFLLSCRTLPESPGPKLGR